MQEEKYFTLHDYIKDYQAGKDMLHELISHQKAFETNGDGVSEEVIRLNFEEKKLNYLLYDLKLRYYWIDRLDIEAWIVDGLFGGVENKGILHQANLNFEPKQLDKWVRHRLDGHVKNQIKKEQLFNKDIIQEGKVDEFGQVGSYFDDASFSEWGQVESDDKYSNFLDSTGGLENLLSKKQYDVFLLSQSHTQDVIAEKLNVTQPDVSQTMTAAEKRLKKAYMDFKTYEIIASDTTSIFNKIKSFQKSYDSILEFATPGQFDLFGFVVKWLKENKTAADGVTNYHELSKNRLTMSASVIDVLTDNVKPDNQKLFRLVLGKRVYADDELILSKREKTKFVVGVVRAFENFDESVIQSISNMNKRFIDTKESEHEKLVSLFII